MLDLKKFARSIFHACRGFKLVAREQNFKIQLFCAIVVILSSILFQLRAWEIAALFMMITLILVLEIINTIFERVVDILEPRVHPYAKAIKDMMASAVLVASIGAILIGFIIFWPHLKSILYV